MYRPECSDCDTERQRKMREPRIKTKPLVNPRGCNDLDQKTCTNCFAVKPIDSFARSGFRNGVLRRSSHCKDCLGVKDRRRYEADVNGKRDRDYRRRLGISLADYERMLQAQGFRCSICGIHESEVQKRFSVDHDHSCCTYGKEACGLCVRGLLCGPCNRGIGLFYDNSQILRAAADYLENARRGPRKVKVS